MNKYEEENLNRILSEIKELEQKEPDMTEEKRAYYLYHRLGEIYMYKLSFILLDSTTERGYFEKTRIYREGTSEKGEAICTDMGEAFVEGLRKLGIKAHMSYVLPPEKSPLTHADVSFKCKNGNWYFANLVSDIMHIQTGMKIRNFGVSQERLEKIKFRRGQKYHVKKMNIENEGKKFSEIKEEQLKKWDDEFGFTHKGMYTNDVIHMIAQQVQDKEFMQEFFGTDKEDELVQKIFEFVMEKIGIVNIHKKKRIGDIEAIEYYQKIAKQILSEEQSKYINLYRGIEDVNGKSQLRNIVVIEKENENIYYLYNSEEQIFERKEKKELINRPIKMNIETNNSTVITNISKFIVDLECKLCDEREI